MEMDLIHYDCFSSSPSLLESIVLALLLAAVIVPANAYFRRRRPPHSATGLRLSRSRHSGGASL